MCGWCKDKWGVSWQITPRALMAAISNPDKAAAKRAFDAMMTMKKIDIAAIEAAVAGRSTSARRRRMGSPHHRRLPLRRGPASRPEGEPLRRGGMLLRQLPQGRRPDRGVAGAPRPRSVLGWQPFRHVPQGPHRLPPRRRASARTPPDALLADQAAGRHLLQFGDCCSISPRATG